MIEQLMPDGFRRRIELSGAWDKTSSDPKKNYGVHGMELRFVLIGEKGATQFLLYTQIHLPHVFKNLVRGPHAETVLAPMGADIGYHAKEPRYAEQTLRDCPYIEGGCYYDGSSLRAMEFTPEFLAGGDDPVWTMLREEYDRIFSSSS